MSTFDIPEGWYGSKNDEGAFFEWLDKIGCVASYRGLNENGFNFIRAELADVPSEADLRDLIALHQRYGRDMSRLAQFRSTENESWFANPIMYWHEAVFGFEAVKA